MLLFKLQHLDEPPNIEELVRYPLTPVPHSLGTADGFFNNTNKAAMLHFLLYFYASENVSYLTHARFIQDGNALFCLHVLDQMIAKNQQGSQHNLNCFLANQDNKKQLCDILLRV